MHPAQRAQKTIVKTLHPNRQPGDASGTKGLEFMAELNKAGTFVAVAARAGTIAQGQTPVVAAQDDNLLAWRDSPAGNPPVEVVIPEGPVLAGVYVQAISACAPHPNAGKLWMEHLFSDEGQNGDVKGYGRAARFNRMVAAGKVPQELPDALPPADAYTRAVFPSVDQQSATKAVVTGQRDTVVGAQGAG
jgi:putative spermidine/putrescine transport system substrate-binding protein